jgi:exopolyphosphatase / guanosine-5'-triphosphate,3'-diphosphate pyrophosphatase
VRVAALDCGTNSLRLLIADTSADPDGAGLCDVVRDMRIVRLGEGVDRTGRLSAAAIERTRVVLADYTATIAEKGAERVRMVATSATRDAANRADFVAMVRATLGADPEVISGSEEAALSFAGAVGTLPAVSGGVLVADIGGGSTELVLGEIEAGRPTAAELRSYSMDVGCVRMTERHLHDDPPTVEQVAATVADLRTAIQRAGQDVPLRTGATLVGVAGTVNTLAALVHKLPEYDPTAIHGSVMTAAQVHAITERLLAMTHAERAALPVMHPGRVDVIGGGALVLRTLVELTGADAVIASEHDILDGIALGLLS